MLIPPGGPLYMTAEDPYASEAAPRRSIRRFVLRLTLAVTAIVGANLLAPAINAEPAVSSTPEPAALRAAPVSTAYAALPASVPVGLSAAATATPRVSDEDLLQPLPVPEPPPSNPYAASPATPIGSIEIPRIGMRQSLYEEVTLTSINRGPSHWPGTARPGERGNVVVAGHRTTYSRPFWDLNRLEPGDRVIFTYGGERHEYQLDYLEVVRPTEVRIINQTDGFHATLFACHPRGSARQRIVAHLSLVTETYAPPPASLPV